MGKAKKLAIGAGIIVVAFFGLLVAAALTYEPKSTVGAATSVDDVPRNVISTQTSNTAHLKTLFYDLSFEIVEATQRERVITVDVGIENRRSGIETIYTYDFRLLDADRQLYEDVRGFLAPDVELAPSANSTLHLIFRVPEGMDISDCQLVVTKDSNNLKYLDLIP